MTMVPRFDKPARTLRTLWIFVVLALALVLGANFLAAQTKSQSAPAQPPQAQKPQPRSPSNLRPRSLPKKPRNSSARWMRS